MKHGLKVLNSKEVKEFKRKLKESYGFEEELNFAFLKNENDRVSIVSRDIDKLSLSSLHINSVGMYFGEELENDVRLSIEGAQIIGPKAQKNVLEINPQKGREYLKGYEIEYPGETKGFVILKSGKDFIGCAKHKDGKLLNYTPKERRIHATD